MRFKMYLYFNIGKIPFPFPCALERDTENAFRKFRPLYGCISMEGFGGMGEGEPFSFSHSTKVRVALVQSFPLQAGGTSE